MQDIPSPENPIKPIYNKDCELNLAIQFSWINNLKKNIQITMLKITILKPGEPCYSFMRTNHLLKHKQREMLDA